MHISEEKNHVCLNCLGDPFTNALTMGERAKKAFKMNLHSESELYLERSLYLSLRLNNRNEKESCKDYVCADLDELLNNLRD